MKSILILTAFCFVVLKLPAQNSIKLVVEPNHSTIGFAIPIGGGTTRVTGKFMNFEIELDYDQSDFTKTSITANIKTESINTGINDRDNDLRSEIFFFTEEHPEIIFTSDYIEKSSEGYLVHGKLKIKGVEKSVVMPAQLITRSENTIGIKIRWKLNRIEYGIGTEFKHTTMPDFLGEEVDIEIDFWTRKKKS